MNNFKITLDIKKLGNQFEKQFQNAQRKAKQEALKQLRIEIAQNIVQNQPVIGGVRMLDKTSEIILEALLKISEERNSLEFNADYDEFQKVMKMD